MSDSLWPHGLQPVRHLCAWIFPGKNTKVSCHSLLQGIFPTQELNPHLLSLLHWQADSLPLSHLGSPHSFWHVTNSTFAFWIFLEFYFFPSYFASQCMKHAGVEGQLYQEFLVDALKSSSPNPYVEAPIPCGCIWSKDL